MQITVEGKTVSLPAWIENIGQFVPVSEEWEIARITEGKNNRNKLAFYSGPVNQKTVGSRIVSDIVVPDRNCGNFHIGEIVLADANMKRWKKIYEGRLFKIYATNVRRFPPCFNYEEKVEELANLLAENLIEDLAAKRAMSLGFMPSYKDRKMEEIVQIALEKIRKEGLDEYERKKMRIKAEEIIHQAIVGTLRYRKS
jgi:hypothetical protein